MIINLIRKMFTKDVLNTSLNQLWRIASGPLSLIFIPFFLTPNLQGFWYTFGSVSALAVFADLGFAFIIMQFAAHEFAFLRTTKELNIEGDSEAKSNLASLFQFVLKWTKYVIIVAYPLIFIIGFFLFISKEKSSVWLLPWVLFSIASALSFFNNIISSFIQGCNQVYRIQRINLISSIVSTVIIFGSLYLGLNLWSLGLAMLISNVVFLILFVAKFKNFLKGLLTKNRNTTNWANSILHLLWKYALSIGSGYFVLNIYTPLMFKFKGPVEAGKVGISISLVTAMFSVSNTWFSANTPRINVFVAKKQWKELDVEFKNNLFLTLGTYCIGVIFLLSVIIVCHNRWAFFTYLSKRFLGLIPIIMLIIGWFIQLIINSCAVYLRAHKEEPLMVVSLVFGLLVFLSTLICAILLPADYFFSGFCISSLLILPFVFLIFYSKKNKWHNPISS